MAGKKLTQFTENTAPTDDDYIYTVDAPGTSPVTKYAKRSTFMSANPIIDPTIKGSADARIFAGLNDGWVDSGYVPDTINHLGNKSYQLVFNGVDLSSMFSVGQKMLCKRTATPKSASTLVAAAVPQYWSKTSPTGISFTDDFTCEAWVKVSTIRGSQMTIVSRCPGTNGWMLILVASTAQVQICGNPITSPRTCTSVESLSKNRWYHVAGALDMSANTGTIWINGVGVTATMGGSGTSLTNSGNVEIGAINGANFPFDGAISDVRVWNIKRTDAQIKANMGHELVGNETNLVGYWKLSTNANDSTSNANNLTANGGAFVANADFPMNLNEYARVTSVAFSTNTTVTVQVANGGSLPTTGSPLLASVAYSWADNPTGFPKGRDYWRIMMFMVGQNFTQSSPVSGTWYNTGSINLWVPLGTWQLGYELECYASRTSGNLSMNAAISLNNNAVSDDEWVSEIEADAVTTLAHILQRNKSVTLGTITQYFAIERLNSSSATNILFRGDRMPAMIYADLDV